MASLALPVFGTCNYHEIMVRRKKIRYYRVVDYIASKYVEYSIRKVYGCLVIYTISSSSYFSVMDYRKLSRKSRQRSNYGQLYRKFSYVWWLFINRNFYFIINQKSSYSFYCFCYYMLFIYSKWVTNSIRLFF